MPPLKLSPWQVITTDYTIFSCLLFQIISMVTIIGNVGDRLFSLLMIVASVVSLIIAGVRYVRILALVNENQVEEAVITRVYAHRGKTRVSFDFTYHGENYRTYYSAVSSKATKKLQPGGSIHVLVDWSKPSRAMILDLFTSNSTGY
jgi:hypothetical protein